MDAMKTMLVTLSLALVGTGSAQAQMLRPSAGGGAVVGAIAGGLIGGHNGDRWAEGAVIGAAAGALIGAALTPATPVYSTPPPVYQVPADYGQRVYTQGGTTVVQAAPTVPNAPLVPDAPMVQSAPPQIVYAPAPSPQVVYVESAPRAVYVPAPPRVVYAAPPPVVHFGFSYTSGPRRPAPPPYRHSHGRGHRSR